MHYLKKYLDKVTEDGNAKLAESISKTAEEIKNKYLKNFSFTGHEIGLLFGNVQSGKTGQMFGIMCMAADLGFPAFVLLTTDNIALQQQTLDRVGADLRGFCICGENDSQLFINNRLMKPVIVVLKKNVRVLKLWANIFCSTGFMKGNPLFIVDDEADAASLNTLVNKDMQSAVNRYLDIIKNGTSSSLYLQVTGTPQAILLQTAMSGWHPYFIYYFSPGDSYLGGDFFFPNNQKPDCIDYLDNIHKPSRAVVVRHLIVSAQILLSGGKVSNCLFHPSVRQSAHKRFAEEIKKELMWCAEHINDELAKELQKNWITLIPTKTAKQPFDALLDFIKGILIKKEIKILVMNSTSNIESTVYASGCNFIVGGNTLGRGVTFPSLQTIYYARTSKKPQADTMWQHSRMFGYDRDQGMMKVFIDESLYKLFSDINATNNSIIAQIERGIQNVKIYYPNNLSPTRKNVMDNDYVEVISGGTNYYPFNPDNDSVDAVSDILKNFSEDEPHYQVSLCFIKEILKHIIPSPDFKLSAFLSVIEILLSEMPAAQGILIVRRGRNVTQGTGALLSPNDWRLGGTITDRVVLTMYQLTGTKGWKRKNLWVPNIKLPHDTLYYDVREEDMQLQQ